MRKDEFIYLHQLLTRVRAEYDQRDEPSADTFSAYDDLSVSPVAAYAPKHTHETAVCTLAAELAAACAAGCPNAADADHQQSPSI